MGTPLISCIVPTYNGERYLAETLGSILAQTYSPLEVIVVDDGSNDRSVEIAKGFGDCVRVVSRIRGGPVAARNFGVGVARGDYVAFLDHDDLWRPEKLALQMAAFDADPALEVCVGHVQRFLDAPDGAEMKMLGDALPGYLTITMLARRAAFDRVGPLDSSRQHSDSAEWFLRGADVGLSVRLLPDVLTFHRTHAANHSRTDGERSRQEFLRLAKARIERHRRGPAKASNQPATRRQR